MENMDKLEVKNIVQNDEKQTENISEENNVKLKKENDEKEEREKSFQQWTLYDTNVQSYRSNMIATDSLLLAVAAIFYEKSFWLTVFTCIAGLYCNIKIWKGVIESRFIISDYHKFNALFGFSNLVRKNQEYLNEYEEISESIYVSNANARKKANEILSKEHGTKYETNWRETRIKLDRKLPFVFNVLWCLVIVFAFLKLLMGEYLL